MVLRMPSTQPPTETSRTVPAGRIRWRRTLLEEFPDPTWAQAVCIGVAKREEIPLEAEEEEGQRGQPEIGEAADEEQQRRQDGID